jgi:deoxyribonuclease-4
MLIGAHVSNAGGLAKAIERGVERGADAVQIFNQSPRMWKPTAYTADDFSEFRDAMDSSRIDAVLIHAVYLVNSASEDPEIRKKSRRSLIHSLQVGAEIGAAGVVLHPGSAKKGDVPTAIKHAGTIIKQALSESEGCELHLEDTAGAGGTLGRSLEELAQLLDAAGGDPRLGLCLDSCHLYASGYDISTREGLEETLERCDEVVGLKRLRSVHVNDSMTKLGSNRDRHALLGEGELGDRGCAVYLSEPLFDALPAVLETGADGSPSAQDVAKAFKLRKRGKHQRARAAQRAARRKQ